MTSVEFEFKPSSLLWRTRGKHWDFEFVSTPSHPNLDAWWSIFNQIFNEIQVDEQPKIYYGELILRQEEVRCYLAAACFDQYRKDWTGRRIQHFLVWFPNGIQSNPNPSIENLIPAVIPADWYNQILKYLNEFFDSEDVFNLSEEEISKVRLANEKIGNWLKIKYLNYFQSDALLLLDKANTIEPPNTSWKYHPIKPDDKACEVGENISHLLNPAEIEDIVHTARRKLTGVREKFSRYFSFFNPD